jgi:hypothetical protein
MAGERGDYAVNEHAKLVYTTSVVALFSITGYYCRAHGSHFWFSA